MQHSSLRVSSCVEVQSFPFSEYHVEEFEVWLKRKYLFYHQFSGYYQDEYSRNLRTQALNVRSFARRPSRVRVGDQFVQSSELQRGFQSSRFCFAIAGRNGGPTRKFYDAVLHSCIPVVVSDQWLYTFAPLHGPTVADLLNRLHKRPSVRNNPRHAHGSHEGFPGT
ncbi:unnamed protein product [Symbiodinium sp. CCMP2456]|nr:unnamed protein product [Symbiodinium sp. CCMP2456]